MLFLETMLREIVVDNVEVVDSSLLFSAGFLDGFDSKTLSSFQNSHITPSRENLDLINYF